MDGMIITIKQLESLGACQTAIDKFRLFFGDSVVVTAALCLAHADDFDWEWAAEHLFTPTQFGQYHCRIAKGMRVVRAGRDKASSGPAEEYNRIMAPLLQKLHHTQAGFFALIATGRGKDVPARPNESQEGEAR